MHFHPNKRNKTKKSTPQNNQQLSNVKNEMNVNFDSEIAF